MAPALDILSMLVQAAQKNALPAAPPSPPPQPASTLPVLFSAGAPALDTSSQPAPSINPGPGQVLPPTSPIADSGEALQRGIARAQEMGLSIMSDREQRLRGLGDQASQLTEKLGALSPPTVGMHVGRDQSLAKNLLNILGTVARATGPVRAIRQGDYQARAGQLTKQLDEIRKQQQSEAAGETAAAGLMTRPLYAQGKAYGADVGAGMRKTVAQINAEAKIHAAEIQAGQVSKLVPGINPETGQPGYQKVDRTGQSKGWVDNAVVPSLLSTQGGEFKEDAAGNYVWLPKTTGKIIPGQRPGQTPAGAVPTGGRSGQPAPFPAPGGAAPRGRGVQRISLKGPKSVESVFAVNPQTNETILTNRGDAVAQGFTGIRNATQPEIENTRMLNNRLADVQQKTERYADSFRKDLSAGDLHVLSALASDQRFEAAFKPGFGIFGGITIPTEQFTNLLVTAQQNGLSREGVERLYAYFNMREAMVGYQRVLSGSGRGNEKQMEMLLQTLPIPTLNRAVAENSFNQFRQNLTIAAQGLPRMPGISTPGDIGNRGTGGSTPPPGARIRDYTDLKP